MYCILYITTYPKNIRLYSPTCILLFLTPDTCPEGELVFEQSSELDEDVDVGVIETELLFPENI